MCKSYTGARFQKPTKIISQYGYVFLLNGKHRELERVSRQRARLLILQQKGWSRGDADRKTNV